MQQLPDAAGADSPAPLPVPAQPEPRWAVQLRQIAPLGTLVTPMILIASSLVALFVFLEAKEQNAAQRAIAAEQLELVRHALKQNNLATIYTLSAGITRWELENPRVARLFNKSLRRPMTDEELWDEFKKLSEDQRTQAYLHCEQIADFAQIAFVQRELFPSEDWDTWWSNITDQYDESPIYRDFLSQRSNWYAFLDAIKPAKRTKFFRGDRKK